MGTFCGGLKSLFCKEKINNHKIKDEQLDESSLKFENTILSNDFFCSKCGDHFHEIPEILKIHSESGKILFRCLKRDKEYEDDLHKYYDEITNMGKCGKCGEGNNDNRTLEYYCLKCRCFLCGSCKNKHKNKKIISNEELNSIWNSCLCLQCSSEEEEKNLIHYIVKINEMSTICHLHGLKTDIPCLDCQKNCCQKCFDKYHKWHRKRNITDKKINDARKKIIDKDDKLLKMKQFYEMVKLAAESNPNNNIYKKNLIKVAKCIEKEKNREKYDADLAIYRLEQINKKDNKKKNK